MASVKQLWAGPVAKQVRDCENCARSRLSIPNPRRQNIKLAPKEFDHGIRNRAESFCSSSSPSH